MRPTGSLFRVSESSTPPTVVDDVSMVGAAPTARLARVQVTVAVPLQLQPLPLALTSVTSGGRESLTLTAEAAFGPALLTLRV